VSTQAEQQDSPAIPVYDFTTQDCKQYSGLATGNLLIDGQMSINGKTDL
jgi:hypothetical protein